MVTGPGCGSILTVRAGSELVGRTLTRAGGPACGTARTFCPVASTGRRRTSHTPSRITASPPDPAPAATDTGTPRLGPRVGGSAWEDVTEDGVSDGLDEGAVDEGAVDDGVVDDGLNDGVVVAWMGGFTLTVESYTPRGLTPVGAPVT